MAKYNIRESKPKDAVYRTLVNPDLMEAMKDRIYQIVVREKKYRDKKYSAKKLAADLYTTTRYVSAVVNVKFGVNYSSFVNQYRIKEAMEILSNPANASLRMQEVSDMVGFANRQSFYASFYRLHHITPREYKLQQLLGPRPKSTDAEEML